ncbi:MAG: EscU/YscU/HrcU family type III secretion system export apparatus switch protein [Thermodesulfovibrionales bacterium]|nr:EscU/YscU/HrcU family type III secretion system export apparatus switch protein [Thermodesulfovibrionales bacterium]
MKDKRLKATALRYKAQEDNAPKVVAKGSGKVAEKIISIAKQHNVPLREDPNLVEILSTLDLYQEIPPDLYRAVAEILAYIYKVSNRLH